MIWCDWVKINLLNNILPGYPLKILKIQKKNIVIISYSRVIIINSDKCELFVIDSCTTQ